MVFTAFVSTNSIFVDELSLIRIMHRLIESEMFDERQLRVA